MATVLLSILMIGLFFVFLSVRLIFIKEGKFRGTCSSQSPWLEKNGGTCSYCGRNADAGESCRNQENTVPGIK